MLGIRYHVTLVGEGMVLNLISSPVLPGFLVVHEYFSECGIFTWNPLLPC